ncbi:type VI secretion system Vgr family protein [Aquabacterium sp.]|uniref:type VI secretion system Vgr family protein n=1 Tax=Aquabacterium sp. TaxID=1872578 RepID=UPI0025BE1E71|nr:type VI secretion system Vgr family protein [Aquabacterium sp.]
MTDLSGIQHALGDAARSVLDGLLAELGSLGPNQHNRLLRLHTPLGSDVLLAERAEVREAIAPGTGLLPRPAQANGPATGYTIELLALSTRADLAPVDLIGQPVLLELLTAQSRDALRPFHGHVTAFELLGADGGYARYRLTIEPWLAFLGHRTDAWVFQGMSVLDITEAVLADYAAQGKLLPQWRFELADRSVYAQRSLCVQFNETDLAFLQRLWAEEGLITWFEHQGNPADAQSLGQHTLVIADHNGAFVPNVQPRIRFTQPGAVISEDTITRWHGHRRVGVSTLHSASFDYRSVANHGASQDAEAAHDQPFALVHADQPGAYAYEDAPQAERRTRVQLQAHEAARKRFEGRGTVRTLAPATSFMLSGHADHDAGLLGGRADDATFVVLGVVHRARNNLSADAKAGLQHLLSDALAGVTSRPALANATEEPLYEAHFTAQRVSVPVRAALMNAHGLALHPKPTVHGTQTAVVVGLGEPVHTDRDGRIKVQFHWQRGEGSSHRLSAPAGDNAPATDAAGTWVRVAQDWAGANWGSVFIPRVGQEVVIGFVEGDIDRPVVVGTAYNGQGTPEAQGNQVAGGAASATGNAPAWFPGSQRAGEREGHAHKATLSGFKSQSLDASQSGNGGHNQLVFDDTPGQGRLLAHSTQSQSWLQIGHLLQQHDNQRLAPRGHGLELHTQAQGALRAGNGLHLSSFARRGGTSTNQGKPMDTREAQSQLDAHASLVKALNENAQTHRAKLPNEAAPDQLGAQKTLQATLESLRATEGGSDGNNESGSEGGQGRIPVSQRPDLLLSAAGDIASLTPAHTVLSTGQHTTLTAGQDTNLLAQRHQAWAVKDGISLFTRGEAKDSQHGVQDVGMKLHAASGNVSVQAQSGAFTLTAAKAIDVQSTTASVVISAPSKLLLNGGGGYIKIEGGDIELGTSGQASFKAGMKELTGGGSGSDSKPELKKAQSIKGCAEKMKSAAGTGGALA